MNNSLLEFEIVRSSRRKTAAIYINDKGVVVRVPLWVSDAWIHEWVNSRRAWIEKNQKNFKQNLSEFCLKTEQGAAFPLLGLYYTLNWRPGGETQVSIEGEEIIVQLSRRSSKPEHERAEKALKAWYRSQAQEVISFRVKHWARVMGLEYNGLKIKSFKRRWGSCSASRELSFNWRLILAEVALIDYVVIHELAHCVHLNHSPQFWEVVETFCPDWKEKRGQLQKRSGWVLW